MEQIEHKCIKCRSEYTDEQPDDYLCPSCNETRLAIAREVDAKMGSTVGQKPTGGWERIEMLKANGIKRNGMSFINAKDL